MRRVPLILLSLGFAILACTIAPAPAGPPQPSIFDSGRTAYGFFPSPPEATLQSVLGHVHSLGDHADFVLIQPNIPWEEVLAGASSESPRLTDNYYPPLPSRTDRPLAVAEGGYTSQPVGPFRGTPQDQVDYLNAIHSQLGGRLRFWVYLLLNDFNPESYADAMRQNGLGDDDINTLGMFTAVGLREADGTPKPALAIWDSFRGSD